MWTCKEKGYHHVTFCLECLAIKVLFVFLITKHTTFPLHKNCKVQTHVKHFTCHGPITESSHHEPLRILRVTSYCLLTFPHDLLCFLVDN